MGRFYATDESILQASTTPLLITTPRSDGSRFDRKEQVILLKLDSNEYRAYWNRCEHVAIPLAWNAEHLFDATGIYLECKTHGALYRTHDGLCIGGPCMGDSLEAVALLIENGRVFLDIEGLETTD